MHVTFAIRLPSFLPPGESNRSFHNCVTVCTFSGKPPFLVHSCSFAAVFVGLNKTEQHLTFAVQNYKLIMIFDCGIFLSELF